LVKFAKMGDKLDLSLCASDNGPGKKAISGQSIDFAVNNDPIRSASRSPGMLREMAETAAR